MPDDTSSAQDLLDEATGCVAVGDVAEAIPLLRRCVEIDATFFAGWHALGMALLRAGDVKEAIGAGMMATTLKPNDLLAWTSLSQMYVKDGQIAEAEDAKGKARILSLGGKVVKD